MRVCLGIFASVSAIVIVFAARSSNADDQTEWLSSRQTEFAKWKALQQPISSRRPSDLSALTEIWDAPAAPKMILVPPGEYTMGSPILEQGRNSNETQHQVTIGYAFAVGKYDVTRAEFAAFVNSTGFKSKDADGCFVYSGKDWRKSESANWQNPGIDQSLNDPVVCVSWNDAQAYSAWLSQQTGQHYRLLSESEYEYAARAGTTTAYWWGDSIGTAKANCGDCGSRWDRQRTSPTGSFPANPFGLYDMNGNVWQWVGDCWSDSYSGAPKNGSAWETGHYDQRVQRGGGWSNNSRYSRAALRSWDGIAIRYADNGFRVAKTL